MQRRTALIWSHLNCLTCARINALKQAFGTLDEALKYLGEDLLKAIGCRKDTVLEILNRFESFDPDAYEKELLKRQLRFATIEDDAYPERLKQISDPPPFLYYYGDLALLNQPSIALVGTRRNSPYGKRVVEHFVPPIVRAGCVTVSGLALGIDTLVAEETLHAGGKTVAVLGSGLANFFPQSNGKLAKKIIASGGLILSEFPLDQPPGTYTFPQRNRIIAGVSLGTVVCEAPEKSGALITAEFALEEGRDIFIVPGSIFDANYAGSNAFLGRGQAKLVTCAEDILKEVGVVAMPAESRSKYESKSPMEAAVMQALTTLPQPADDVVAKANLPLSDVSATLTMLELAGAAKKIGDGWVRV